MGTTTIKKTVQVPGNATVIRAYPVGLKFTAGISFSATGRNGRRGYDGDWRGRFEHRFGLRLMTYSATVLADVTIRYYKLNETSGDNGDR